MSNLFTSVLLGLWSEIKHFYHSATQAPRFFRWYEYKVKLYIYLIDLAIHYFFPAHFFLTNIHLTYHIQPFLLCSWTNFDSSDRLWFKFGVLDSNVTCITFDHFFTFLYGLYMILSNWSQFVLYKFFFFFQPIGCDWIVGSNASNDICGVCRGDNSTCRIISGEYTEQPKLNSKLWFVII